MMQIDLKELSDKEKIALVCLYFAQLKSNDYRYTHFTIKLKALANKFRVKYRTVANYKDCYDAVFENGRSGWHQLPLEKKSKYLYEIYKKYQNVPFDELEIAVSEILAEVEKEDVTYFSIKTKNPITVAAILAKNSNVEFDGLNILKDMLQVGQPVFIVFGGDKPEWETGLVGMGIISEAPYDVGYDKKNYRIKVDVKLLLDKPIKREDLIPYRDTYGIIGIGPIVKWEPNQALSQVSEKSAIALMRAMLEFCPQIEKDLENIIPERTITRIKGAITKFAPIEVNYQESLNDGIKEMLENPDFDIPSEPCIEEEEEYTKDDFLNDVYMEESSYDLLQELLEKKKNIILQGVPGVGKTFVSKRFAYSLLGRKSEACIQFVQFHQSYSYEDFIVGYRPSESSFVLEHGPFYDFCKKAEKDDRKHFFIIDEINRGNLSKIFGELLMLIEADKRGQKAMLLYGKELFSVPKNVYIIGMMNTADRSLALIDYALRRRFSFFEIEPAFNSPKFTEQVITPSSSNIGKIIDTIKELNADILSDDSLGKGFQIGHSYFCSEKSIDDNHLKMVIEYEIIPLLNEYWFDEPSKIEYWTSRLRGSLK